MPVENKAPGGEDRLKSFKNKGKDTEVSFFHIFIEKFHAFTIFDHFFNFQDLRRRRNEVTVDLRKQKKEDLLYKRRNVCLDDSDLGPTSPLQDKSNSQNNQQALMSIDEIKEGIFANDYNVAFKATQAARKILSRERNPPIGNFFT